MHKCVFLDRDGVLNVPVIRDGKSYPPATMEGFSLCDGVEAACRLLKEAGYLLVVVTNQPDVRTGKQQRAVIDGMHAYLRSVLPLDDILVCFHIDEDDCDCRKPKPGMLLDAARGLDIDLGQSFMVGDRWRDIEAGQRVGCRCYFIDYGYAETPPVLPWDTAANLLDAAQKILSDGGGG